MGGTKTIDAATIAISRTTNGLNALPRMVGEGERDNNHLLGIGSAGLPAGATQPQRLNTMPRMGTPQGRPGGWASPCRPKCPSLGRQTRAQAAPAGAGRGA